MDVEALLNPSSVAVVGASENPSIGRSVVENLRHIGFGGTIAPVNPKYAEVLGLECRPSLTDLDISPDVVVFCVGARRVLESYRLLPGIGAAGAVIFDGGFAEAGPSGRELQAEIAAISRSAGIVLCGPNCMGYLNPAGATAAYAQLVHDPGQLHGNVGLVSQSGSVCIGLMSDTRRFGFSTIVSSGNEAVVTTADYIDHLVDDRSTGVIAVFSEYIADPEHFVAALDRAAAAGKPVVVLKAGRTPRSQRAVTSHTGALCGSAPVFSALLRAHRAIEVKGLDELTEVLAACQAAHLPAGHRASVVTASGGLVELMLDTAPTVGIELPPLSAADRNAVESFMGPVPGEGNPLDAWGSGHFETNLPKVLEVARASDDIDVVVFPNDAFDGQPMGGRDFGRAYTPWLAASAAASDKPHYQLNTRPGLMHRTQVELLASGGGATLGGLRQGLSAIARLADFSLWRPRPALDGTPSQHRVAALLAGGDRPAIHEYDSKRVLRGYGVPVASEQMVTSVAEARRAAAEVGFPVVLKALADRAAHKWDLGLVKLGIVDSESLEQAWDDLAASVQEQGLDTVGMLVQEMVAGGVEVLVGVSRDADFGLALALGPGGIAADLSEPDEVARRVLPLGVGDAADMVTESSRLRRMLSGFRGQPPADVDALVGCIEALAGFAWAEREQLAEVDLNPVVVLSDGRGCAVVDALIVPRSAEPEEESHGR